MPRNEIALTVDYVATKLVCRNDTVPNHIYPVTHTCNAAGCFNKKEPTRRVVRENTTPEEKGRLRAAYPEAFVP